MSETGRAIILWKLSKKATYYLATKLLSHNNLDLIQQYVCISLMYPNNLDETLNKNKIKKHAVQCIL